MFDSSHPSMSHENGQRSCFCNVYGVFQLQVKDIRLTHVEPVNCPSVSVNACSANGCNSTESNCRQGIILNKIVSNNARSGNISIKGLSMLMSPSLIWIQILHKSKYYFMKVCFCYPLICLSLLL